MSWIQIQFAKCGLSLEKYASAVRLEFWFYSRAIFPHHQENAVVFGLLIQGVFLLFLKLIYLASEFVTIGRYVEYMYVGIVSGSVVVSVS
jgi:hypothetical protein